MSRTDKFIYNSLSAAVLQAISIVSALLIPIAMLNAYGSEINGLIVSIMQFIAYITLIESGLAGASIYALYKPLADHDEAEISSVVAASRKQYMATGYVFVALIILLAALYPLFIKSDIIAPLSMGTLVLLLGVAGAMEFFTMAKYRVLLTADQKAYVISTASMVAIVLNTSIVVTLAHFKVNILLLQFVAIFAVFARSLVLSIYVRLRYSYVNYDATPNYKALDKRYDALYLQILGSVHNATPIVIATLFTTLKTVSVFSIYLMIIGGVNGIVRIFTAGLSASFGDLVARKEKALLQQAYQEFELGYYMVISVIYSCCIVLIMPFIGLYTHGIVDTNYYLYTLGMLVVADGFVSSMKSPQGLMIIAAGMYRETRWQTVTQGLIAVVGGVIFVQFWGLEGIVMGSILSNAYRTIDLLFFVPKRITELRPVISTKRIVLAFFAFFLIYLSFSRVVMNISSYYDFFLYASAVAIYSSMVVLLINYSFDKSIFLSVIARMSGAVRRFRGHDISVR